MDQPSDALLSLTSTAMAHASSSVRDIGSPMLPFALISVDGSARLHRVGAGALEEQVAGLRYLLDEAVEADLGVLSWDGYLTHDGVRTDAVFVSAHERGQGTSVVLAQRYRTRRTLRGRKVQLLGEPVDAGHGGPLLG